MAKHSEVSELLLEPLHNTILGVTRKQQWKLRNTSKHLASTFAMQQLLSDFVTEQCLRWLVHLVEWAKSRLCKKVLHGELNRDKPYHRTKSRWRDAVWSHVEAIGVSDRWYELCLDRKEWFEFCKEWTETRSRQKNVQSVTKQPQYQGFNSTSGRRLCQQEGIMRPKRFWSHTDYGFLPFLLGYTQDIAILMASRFKMLVCLCVRVHVCYNVFMHWLWTSCASGPCMRWYRWGNLGTADR